MPGAWNCSTRLLPSLGIVGLGKRQAAVLNAILDYPHRRYYSEALTAGFPTAETMDPECRSKACLFRRDLPFPLAGPFQKTGVKKETMLS